MSAEKKTKAKAKKTTARRRMIGRRPGQDAGDREAENLPTKQPLVSRDTQPTDEHVYDLPVSVPGLLRETIQEVIDAAQAAGDYTYVSFSDFVRAAIREHIEDPRLLAQAQEDGGRHKRTSVRCDKEIMDQWHSWPERARRQILERVLRTKLLKMGGQFRG